jgi:putative isomerase
LALKLGKNDEADDWKKKSDHLLKHMLDELWDGDRFITVNIEDGSVNEKSLSSQRFIPFIVGKKLPDDIRAKMIKDLKGGGYLTDWGIATESIHSPFYQHNGYWTGPIWAPHTLIIADGLKRAGEHELSKEIAQKFCNLCVKSGFAENFDPKTGEALRDTAYTWTASVFLLLGHEYLD